MDPLALYGIAGVLSLAISYLIIRGAVQSVVNEKFQKIETELAEQKEMLGQLLARSVSNMMNTIAEPEIQQNLSEDQTQHP